jgi:hypothetical protein
MISTLTGRKIGQVERVDKTCFGDEASRQARALDQLEPMRLDEPTIRASTSTTTDADTVASSR